ncbi:MAG TPA: carboxypeptidase-like regulatory domain-containing protein [Bacteroidales bacterium]|nr:carboxypeptidase-like regulatory domain-containing protein [Bacteroidales bacterium]
MKIAYSIVLILLISVVTAFAGNDNTDADKTQSNGVISGQVVDKLTGEGLGGVKINFSNGIELYTDLNGNFELIVTCNNSFQLQTSYISYETFTIANLHINPGEKQVLRVEMKSIED